MRRYVAKIRLSAHRLPIENGRYAVPPIARQERICEICKSYNNVTQIGDESHFLFDCKVSIANIHLLNHTNKQLWLRKDEQQLFKNEKRGNLNNFAHYIKKCYQNYADITEKNKINILT